MAVLLPDESTGVLLLSSFLCEISLSPSYLDLGWVEKWRVETNAEKGGAWQTDGGEACREDKTRREGADSNAAPILQIISAFVATTTGSVFVQT